MNREVQKSRMVENVTMKDIKTFFVNYIFSDNFAKADFFEVGALHRQCKRLVQLHSDAIDFLKREHHQNFRLYFVLVNSQILWKNKQSYESQKSSWYFVEYTPQTNLNIENFDQRLYVDGYEEFWMMHES
ncbi:14600_t:CDS:2 [Rhizophagus irregularis]|nr:14600_t:CDS:2 [Rhizophagus irregularis]